MPLTKIGINKVCFSDYSSNYTNLTPRETEIVQYTIQGKSARVIAAILNISLRTVEKHIENIKTKMCVLSKTALIEKSIG